MRKSLIALAAVVALTASVSAQPLTQYLFDGLAGPGFVLNSGTLGGSDVMVGHSLTGVAPDGSPCLLGSGVAGDQIQTSIMPATNLAAGSFTIGFCLDTSANGAFQYCFGDQGSSWRCFTQGAAGVGNITMRGAGLTDCIIPAGSGDAGWVHVAWSYDAATGDVLGYLNGALVTSVAGVTMTHNGATATSLFVGGYSGTGGSSTFLLGSQMEDFRLWDNVQAPSAIQSWACACLAGVIPGTEWDTNSPECEVLTDGIGVATTPGPIVVDKPLNTTAVIDFQSTLTGNPYEVVFSLGADTSVPANGGGLPFGGCPGSALNINLLAPTFGTLFNGAFAVPFANFSLNINSPAPFAGSYQMVMLNPAAPAGLDFSAPTDLSFSAVPCITIEADGANLFTTTSGWKAIHRGNCTEAIESITIDNFNAMPGSVASFVYWDTDQTGMADRFDGGNSVVAGSLGTYRNGSDVTCGLIYDALNTPTASTIDPTANTGWIGTNPTGLAGNYYTIQFRYTPGVFFGTTFEWDMDPDYPTGGAASGAGQDGCFVTVVTNASTYSGFMVADPVNTLRASIDFL